MRHAPLEPVGKLTLWLLALLIVSVAFHARDLSTAGLLDREGRLKASDYMRLYVTGALAREGRWHALYDADAHVNTARAVIDPRLEMAGLHPNYGPTAAVVLAPLTHLTFLRSWAFFSLASVVVLLIGVYALTGRCLHVSAHIRVALLAAAASPALFDTIRYGQLSAVTTTLFAVAATLASRQRLGASGFVLGMAFYKPNLILPALVLLILRREWALAGGALAGIATHLVVGVAAGGLAPTVQWFEVLRTLASQPGLVQGFPADVHSLQGFARLLGVTPPALSVVTLGGAALSLGAAAWIWSRTPDFRIRWAALVLVTLLASPHLLTYDLLLLTVPFVLLVDVWVEMSPRPGYLGWLLAGLYLSPIVSPLVAGATGVQLSTLMMTATLAVLWRRS